MRGRRRYCTSHPTLPSPPAALALRSRPSRPLPSSRDSVSTVALALASFALAACACAWRAVYACLARHLPCATCAHAQTYTCVCMYVRVFNLARHRLCLYLAHSLRDRLMISLSCLPQPAMTCPAGCTMTSLGGLPRSECLDWNPSPRQPRRQACRRLCAPVAAKQPAMQPTGMCVHAAPCGVLLQACPSNQRVHGRGHASRRTPRATPAPSGGMACLRR